MKKIAILLLLLATTVYGFACSTFLLNRNGRLVFGRNYDWVTGNGMMLVNTAGLLKTAFVTEKSKALNWISKFGSVTFNQFGKEFPHGGMNEKGLVVELMWLEGTVYPAADKRAAVNELQWIQYQLDNCTTVEEVVATDKLIRIERENAVPLHFLIADANGNAATIEFLEGKMVVHQGNNLQLPVLTNSTYESSIAQYAGNKNTSNNSLDRFNKACSMLQQLQAPSNTTNLTDDAFNILNKVSQGDFTKWSIVYDISNRSISFTTLGNQVRRQIAFSSLNFSCNAQAMYIDLHAHLKGNISPHLKALSASHNKLVVNKSANECKSQVQISKESLEALDMYFTSIRCKS